MKKVKQAIAAVRRITQWSYSRFRDWKQCPAKAAFKYIDKLEEPGSEAMERGNRVHKELEQHLLGKLKRFSAEVGPHFLKELDKLRKVKGLLVEEQWAFTVDWVMTEWFAKDVWLRVKMDVAWQDKDTAEGIDHKTGKFRPGEYDDQMFQYCIALLLAFPKAKKARVRLWFHDNGMTDQKVLTRPFLEQSLAKLKAQVQPMLLDEVFPPTPNDKCKWCHFSKKKGGPCTAA
jgi:CRISPR/Cas system-associated exonuclease Cas4 (RecB family)